MSQEVVFKKFLKRLLELDVQFLEYYASRYLSPQYYTACPSRAT
jgi:hypothetical protein